MDVRYAADGTLPDPESTDNAEFKIVLALIRREYLLLRAAVVGGSAGVCLVVRLVLVGDQSPLSCRMSWMADGVASM